MWEDEKCDLWKFGLDRRQALCEIICSIIDRQLPPKTLYQYKIFVQCCSCGFTSCLIVIQGLKKAKWEWCNTLRSSTLKCFIVWGGCWLLWLKDSVISVQCIDDCGGGWSQFSGSLVPRLLCGGGGKNSLPMHEPGNEAKFSSRYTTMSGVQCCFSLMFGLVV